MQHCLYEEKSLECMIYRKNQCCLFSYSNNLTIRKQFRILQFSEYENSSMRESFWSHCSFITLKSNEKLLNTTALQYQVVQYNEMAVIVCHLCLDIEISDKSKFCSCVSWMCCWFCTTMHRDYGSDTEHQKSF